MKKGFWLLAGAIGFSGSVAALEDVTAAFTVCANTRDDTRRLACYDKIADRKAAEWKAMQAKQPGYAEIGLVDLKVDIKDMLGKRVSVRASIQTMGEMSMLKSDPVDMAPVWAETEKLPREDRKKLASGCQMVMCSGTFFGVIKQGNVGPALLVEKVEWR